MKWAMSARLIVIAKAPRAGLSKTRLCPPCTPGQAAELAEAALADTLEAAATAASGGCVLALEGRPGRWMRPEFELIPQRGDGLAARLAAAFEDSGGPAVLIGMDTPQLSPSRLEHALAELDRPGVDAVIGPASDGGYWAIGLRRPDRRAFVGVPMSTGHTYSDQLARLRALGLRVEVLPELRDVDEIDDARAVAGLAGGTRFARLFSSLSPGFSES